MAQPVPEAPVKVGPVAQGVHLVDPDPLQARRGRFDGVEHRHRLAVGQGNDHVGPWAEKVHDGLRADRCRERPPMHRHKSGEVSPTIPRSDGPARRVEAPCSTSGADGKLRPDITGPATDRRSAMVGLHLDPVEGPAPGPSRPERRS